MIFGIKVGHYDQSKKLCQIMSDMVTYGDEIKFFRR